jgi:hypothetical protein
VFNFVSRFNFFIALLPICLLWIASAQAQTQLLPNPGFESGNVNWVANTSGVASIINDPTNAHTGNWYADLHTAGALVNLTALTTAGSRYFAVSPGDVLSWGG